MKNEPQPHTNISIKDGSNYKNTKTGEKLSTYKNKLTVSYVSNQMAVLSEYSFEIHLSYWLQYSN